MNYKADCPYCSKEGHFYINYVNGQNDCKKCGYQGNLFTFLQAINRLDLVDEDDIDLRKDELARLVDGNDLETEEINLHLPNIKMPTCSKRVEFGDGSIYDTYLQERKFKQIDYGLYEPVYTDVVDKFKDYAIVKVFRDYLLKGYIGRYVGNDKEAMRYINSVAEFSKLLFGYDEIESTTTTAILTEGIFDKVGVTTEFELHGDRHLKCLCTFGKKVSEAQIKLLKTTKLRNIILLHDGRDAINEMKKNGFKLKDAGFKVQLGYMPTKDPADSSQDELIDVFSNLLSPEQFWSSKLQIK